MRNFLLFSSLLLLIGNSLWGQDQSALDRRVREGQDAIYRLDYAEAERIFNQLITENPDNPVGYGMLSITTWNQLLFASANYDIDDYATPTPFSKGRTHKDINREIRHFRETNDNLLALCERLLEKNPKDDLALYFKGLA